MGYTPCKLPGAQSSSIWKEKDIITRSLPSSTLEDSKTYRTFCRFIFGNTSREPIFMPDNHELLWALGMGYGRILNWTPLTPLQKRQCVTWIICTPASGGWLRGERKPSECWKNLMKCKGKTTAGMQPENRQRQAYRKPSIQVSASNIHLFILNPWAPETVQMQDGNQVDILM